MNILLLYDKYATHTNTVYEHVAAFSRHSIHHTAYCHGEGWVLTIKWERFDVVVIHYSLRIAYGVVSSRLMRSLANFPGVKVLFVQDEYDYTERTRQAIDKLGIDLVYTCVPNAHRESVYPASRFPNVRFVETFTGFAPAQADRANVLPIAQRPIVVGYRGRALPYWYGDLGQEKQIIAEGVKGYCVKRGIPCDIEWDDKHRIYGDQWLSFLGRCKATLATESGSNLFDDHGDVRQRFNEFLRAHPNAAYREARVAVLGDLVELPIMNQVSPRIFEAIASGCALVLFDGKYSGVVEPDRHFIPLRKNLSNIDQVFRLLEDDAAIQSMTERAYDDVIGSGRYTYAAFIAAFDSEVEAVAIRKQRSAAVMDLAYNWEIRSEPLRMPQPKLPGWLGSLWHAIPLGIRVWSKPAARRAWHFVEKNLMSH